jgi:hypothetical protein
VNSCSFRDGIDGSIERDGLWKDGDEVRERSHARVVVRLRTSGWSSI